MQIAIIFLDINKSSLSYLYHTILNISLNNLDKVRFRDLEIR